MIKTRTMSITSGKGGVGKRTLVYNLALGMAEQGKRVLILDGDLGMGNIDIMFGVRSRGSIYDVINGNAELSEVLTELHPNIQLIPGGSGVYGLHDLSIHQKQLVLDQVEALEGQFDLLLIDTAPGIADNVLYLNSASEEIVIVLTPEPTSLADAYALIKVLNQRQGEKKFSVIANMVRDEREALLAFQRLSDVASRFLYVSLDFKGFVPMDLNLRQAIKSQQLILKSCASSPSAMAIRDLAKKISNSQAFYEPKGGLQFFWRHLSGVA
ncbi:MAG: MinD/ParA family protein [Bdellovibrionales bacterium]|nr:MinD/ParA family protein [Bdellovibrionales bacterium]